MQVNLRHNYFFLTLQRKQKLAHASIASANKGIRVVWPRQFPKLVIQPRKSDLLLFELGAKKDPYDPDGVSADYP